MTSESSPPALNEREQACMDKILAAMESILQLDGTVSTLRANSGELASAVHVLQQFPVQHMLHRLDPENWSNWWEER